MSMNMSMSNNSMSSMGMSMNMSNSTMNMMNMNSSMDDMDMDMDGMGDMDMGGMGGMGGMDMGMMSSGPWWEPGIAMEVVSDKGYIWTSRVFDFLSILIISTVIIIHVYILITYNYEEEKAKRSHGAISRENSLKSKSREKSRDKSRENSVRSTSKTPYVRHKSISHLYQNPSIRRWTAALNITTVLYALITLSVLVLLVCTSFAYLSVDRTMAMMDSCSALVKSLCIMFHLSKTAFYAVLITRLQVAFGVSALRYSFQIIYSLYAFVFVYTLFLCIGTIFAIEGMLMTVAPNVTICHIHIYDTDAAEVGVFLWIFMDMAISIVLLYLFQRPIRGLLSGNLKRSNTKLGKVMTKYAILTWLSVLWALLSLLLYLWKHLTILIEMGGPLSVICMVLMHSKYQKMYKLCCTPCIKCVMCCVKNEGDIVKNGTNGSRRDVDESRKYSTRNIIINSDATDGGIDCNHSNEYPPPMTKVNSLTPIPTNVAY